VAPVAPVQSVGPLWKRIDLRKTKVYYDSEGNRLNSQGIEGTQPNDNQRINISPNENARFLPFHNRSQFSFILFVFSSPK